MSKKTIIFLITLLLIPIILFSIYYLYHINNSKKINISDTNTPDTVITYERKIDPSQLVPANVVISKIIEGLNSDPVRTNNGQLHITSEIEFQNEGRKVDFFSKTQKGSTKQILLVVKEMSYNQIASFVQYERNENENFVTRTIFRGMNKGNYQEALEIANNISSVEDINKELQKGDKGFDKRFGESKIFTHAEKLQQHHQQAENEQKIQEVCGEPNLWLSFVLSDYTRFPRKTTKEEVTLCYNYYNNNPQKPFEQSFGEFSHKKILDAIERSQH